MSRPDKFLPSILALDTATEACSAALQVGARVLERFEDLDRGHSERILPMIDELLHAGGIALADLDAIAFGRGPGAFTGVRLAASVTQGLAFGAGLPVVPISNLALLAAQAFRLDRAATHVWVAADARMQEIYCATYQRVSGHSGQLNSVDTMSAEFERLGEERVVGGTALVLPPAELEQAARADSSGLATARVVAIGRALRAYPAVAVRLDGWCAARFAHALPQAVDMLPLASRAFLAGRAVPAELALPVYVRDDVARVPVIPVK